MLAKNDTACAVNPVQLAIATGITKPKPFSLAGVVPNVPRPDIMPARYWMLTDQLQGPGPGCCTTCKDSMQGMGLPGGVSPYYGIPGLGRPGLGYFPGVFPFVASMGFYDPDLVYPPEDYGAPTPGGNISLLGAITAGVNFIPGYGQIAATVIASAQNFIHQFEEWFHIGAGRREADMIVPTQNDLVYNKLSAVTNAFKVGQTPTVQQLQFMYREVWQYAVSFMEFVLMPQFTDRRASGQALNTVMPYIDGTCGYAVPLGRSANPTQSNCIGWGTGQIGGDGTNGMMGALTRAIQSMNGSIPVMPASITEAANTGFKIQSITPPVTEGFGSVLPIALGIGALLLYKKGLF